MVPTAQDPHGVLTSTSEQFDRSNNVGFEPSNLPEDHMVLWVCTAGHQRYASFAELQASQWQCTECLRLNNKHFLCDYPEVVKQLVDEGVDSSKMRAGSHKVLKWHCDLGPDHTWSAAVYSRTVGKKGCPFCANQILSQTNCLANFPNIYREFHPFRNGFLTAEMIVAYSTQEYWWLCALCGHEWPQSVRSRTQRRSPCPECKWKLERAKRIRISNMLSKRNKTFKCKIQN
jgi:hypothetical protein